MQKFIKQNFNTILIIFLLLQPLIDLLTGLCLHLFSLNLTIGVIIRFTFLLFVIYSSLFIFNKKKLLIPYLIVLAYSIFYLLGIIIYKDGVGLFTEFQNLLRVFYFPLLLLSLYTLRTNLKISTMTLMSILVMYIIFIFVPTSLGMGYKTYEITKAGTLGFFNSANEISGLLSLLTPIMFIILKESKQTILKIIFLLVYLYVILTIGTKTPLLTLIITSILALLYLSVKSFKKKIYKPIIISITALFLSLLILILVLPTTNFYKNIKTHLDYLEVDDITDIFEDEKLIDHFIFSQRITFLKRRISSFKTASSYQKLFGIGYLKNNKKSKLIEMDYFDIYFNHGLIGFIIFFALVLFVFYKILDTKHPLTFSRYMQSISLILIIFLSLFTGHIITSPSVSLISIIIILSLYQNPKKTLLFADKNMEIGGIEKAQLTLLNNINYDKYAVTLILEEKCGPFLDSINPNVTIKELKVSTNKNIFLRKIINFTRKLFYSICNYHTYDFSCCYTTYSYSCNKIAKTSSLNNVFYVHSNYKDVYETKEEVLNFFDSRKVADYRHIIFVSNEAKDYFLTLYPNLESKTKVFNNFVNIPDIQEKSKEKISLSHPKNKLLFTFVGRLDDSSKKLSRAINLISELNDVVLWIIGSGPDEKMYQDLVEAKKLSSKVKFLGKQANPYPYMKESDYLILTSDYEGFPVVYLEGIVLNIPFITTIDVSDESINIGKDYASIISKNPKKIPSEVKKIISSPKKIKKINLEAIQNQRMKNLEKIFEEVE